MGYLLGIPAFAFSPTAFQAIELCDEQLGDPKHALIWLAAPLAAELANHKDFRAADPRQAIAFLDVAQQKNWCVLRGFGLRLCVRRFIIPRRDKKNF